MAQEFSRISYKIGGPIANRSKISGLLGTYNPPIAGKIAATLWPNHTLIGHTIAAHIIAHKPHR